MTRRRAGFTLLEVLVAVAVLGLGLVSLLGLHVRNLALLERDQRITDATLLARALMTEVEVEPFPDEVEAPAPLAPEEALDWMYR